METELFVPIGRDLGLYGVEEGVKYYAVGSSLNPIILSHVEYFAWSKVKNYSSILKWKEELRGNLKEKFPEIDLDLIFIKLLKSNLISPWHFEDPENELLVYLFAVRNGIPLGEENGKWRIGSPLKKDKTILTKEQYVLWNAAAGNITLIEILKNVMMDLGVDDDNKVLNLLTIEGAKLVKLGLWNVEFIPMNSEETSDEA